MSDPVIWTSTDLMDRRDRIIEAARDEVAQLGYDKAGLRDIAARAGLSKSAIYLDFDSKEALVDALIQQESVSVASWLLQDLETKKAGLRFGMMFARTSALLEEHPFLKALRQGIDLDTASSLLKNDRRQDRRGSRGDGSPARPVAPGP